MRDWQQIKADDLAVGNSGNDAADLSALNALTDSHLTPASSSRLNRLTVSAS